MADETDGNLPQQRQKPKDETFPEAPSDGAASSGGVQSSSDTGGSEPLSTPSASEDTSIQIHGDEEGAPDATVSTEASLGTQNKQMTVDDEGKGKDIASIFYVEENDESIGCASSSDQEELIENATSLETSLSSSSDQPQNTEEDHFDMSSLMSSLPKKKGLSKYYDGKSESFKSFANVTRVEDLAKPVKPYKKGGSPSGRRQDVEKDPSSPGASPKTKK